MTARGRRFSTMRAVLPRNPPRGQLPFSKQSKWGLLEILVTPEENGDTFLTGTTVDQAALHGLLRKVRDPGVQLISVERIQLSVPFAATRTF